MKKILSLFGFMMLTVALVACGGDSDDALVGTWQSSADLSSLGIEEISVTFNSNGSGIETWDESTWEFTWEVTGDNLQVTFDEGDEEWETTFEISGDELTITGGQWSGTWYKQ